LPVRRLHASARERFFFCRRNQRSPESHFQSPSITPRFSVYGLTYQPLSYLLPGLALMQDCRLQHLVAVQVEWQALAAPGLTQWTLTWYIGLYHSKHKADSGPAVGFVRVTELYHRQAWRMLLKPRARISGAQSSSPSSSGNASNLLEIDSTGSFAD
jgi:hypothetical protein